MKETKTNEAIERLEALLISGDKAKIARMAKVTAMDVTRFFQGKPVMTRKAIIAAAIQVADQRIEERAQMEDLLKRTTP